MGGLGGMTGMASMPGLNSMNYSSLGSVAPPSSSTGADVATANQSVSLSEETFLEYKHVVFRKP
jgi:hypothetical protein